MAKTRNIILLPDEVVLSKIYHIRDKKVMLDRDLAELYDVDTKVLKQSVRRNINRFPEDFMFEMNSLEFEIWRSQYVTSKSIRQGLRYPPFCFTEQGVAMLSSVLNSDTAIRVNIQIIRVFTRMREMMMTHSDILLQLEKLEKRVDGQGEQIKLVFEYLKQLLNPPVQPRRKIGFRRHDEDN